jgi:hypothetical protein
MKRNDIIQRLDESSDIPYQVKQGPQPMAMTTPKPTAIVASKLWTAITPEIEAKATAQGFRKVMLKVNNQLVPGLEGGDQVLGSKIIVAPSDFENMTRTGDAGTARRPMGVQSAEKTGIGAPPMPAKEGYGSNYDSNRSGFGRPKRDMSDEANLLYIYKDGKLRQKMVSNSNEREARQMGFRDTPEQALRLHGIIRSKFDPKKFVQNVGGKWVPVNPFGDTESVAEGHEDRTSYQVAKILADKGVKYAPELEGKIINAIGLVMIQELGMDKKIVRNIISRDDDFLADTLSELHHMTQGLSEGKTTKAEAPKPRNFVAKNAKMGGAGQHKDKKKAQKQGDVKHKKALAEEEIKQANIKTVTPQGGVEIVSKDPNDPIKSQTVDQKFLIKDPKTGSLMLNKTAMTATGPGQTGAEENPIKPGAPVSVVSAEDVHAVGAHQGAHGDEVTDINTQSPIGGDQEHDEITKLLVSKLRQLAGMTDEDVSFNGVTQHDNGDMTYSQGPLTTRQNKDGSSDTTATIGDTTARVQQNPIGVKTMTAQGPGADAINSVDASAERKGVDPKKFAKFQQQNPAATSEALDAMLRIAGLK